MKSTDMSAIISALTDDCRKEDAELVGTWSLCSSGGIAVIGLVAFASSENYTDRITKITTIAVAKRS